MSPLNNDTLQLILSASSKNSMAEGSQNPKLAEKNYISHILNWQRHLVTNSKGEESRLKDLHPCTRPLSLDDLESCVILENSAYQDKRDCASKEKIKYRLSKCGELCLGLFCTVVPGSGFKAETLATSLPVETGRENKAVGVLLGHIIASKTNDMRATDNSMGVPEDWESTNPKPSPLGHHEDGRTIVLHSVAVLPTFRSRGIGKTLVMALIHQVKGTGISDRLALLAHEDMVAWYEKRQFSNLGPSTAQYGSGEWYDMVQELEPLSPEDKSDKSDYNV